MPYSGGVGSRPVDLVQVHGLPRGASFTLRVTGDAPVNLIEQATAPSVDTKPFVRLNPGPMVRYEVPTSGGTWVWCSEGGTSRVALGG